MHIVVENIGWAVLFVAIGSLVGVALVAIAAFVVPRIANRLTPNIDEEKEIARGNHAVATYFGLIANSTQTDADKFSAHSLGN